MCVVVFAMQVKQRCFFGKLSELGLRLFSSSTLILLLLFYFLLRVSAELQIVFMISAV